MIHRNTFDYFSRMNKSEKISQIERSTEDHTEVIWQSIVGFLGFLLIVYATLAGIFYYVKLKHKPKR